ncbi:DUF262 domain-containing protein [Polaromonas sp. CF318]|uniref:GmrSD restriction endonuclease domain-containing protein n=1 Tax=Polaromonas sp. CF318 TaxID=1144318 RepID=UPI001EE67127|nr:DUF262 domain-containing protein [Polaromonas sp. CF318]
MTTALSVRQENIQRVYNDYNAGKFVVNRRYQRKLVWDVEDKQSLIDTILKGFPIPLFLLARGKYVGTDCLEIIDGMQRLNAIFSFINQEFSFEGDFFDLKTMVESQDQLDKGTLKQQTPVMSRDNCVKIATYTIAISEFASSKEEFIDEVFRRINSNGKFLSPQEVRSAGAVSPFAELVKHLAQKIRGDVSTTDLFPLQKMPEISLSDTSQRGIHIDKTFWVAQGIFVRQQVRESRDEEIIADILAFILMGKEARSASEVLDDYYGIHRYEAGESRKVQLQEALQKYGVEKLQEHFLYCHSTLEKLMGDLGKSFSDLAMKDMAAARAARYYQCVFLAFFELLVRGSRTVGDANKLGKVLSGIGQRITITPGGKWSGTERETNVNIVIGLIQSSFVENPNPDPASTSWLTQFSNLLKQSKLEQPCYDFKQGFLNLKQGGGFDEGCFEGVLQTVSALANQGPKTVGYVLIGVADKKTTADRHTTISGEAYAKSDGHFITGIDFEAKAISGNLDKYQQYLVQRIKASTLEDQVKAQVLNDIRFVSVYDKHCLVMKVKDIGRATHYNNQFFIRAGANTEEAKGTDIVNVALRFS